MILVIIMLSSCSQATILSSEKVFERLGQKSALKSALREMESTQRVITIMMNNGELKIKLKIKILLSTEREFKYI